MCGSMVGWEALRSQLQRRCVPATPLAGPIEVLSGAVRLTSFPPRKMMLLGSTVQEAPHALALCTGLAGTGQRQGTPWLGNRGNAG
jgi:hypothetical protein